MVKDTGAAVRNEEEMQVVWQTCDSSPEGIPFLQFHLNNKRKIVITGWFGELLADDEW